MLLRVTEAETITRREHRDVVILAERPALTITWSRYAAGDRGPDPHVHREHTDAFYVLDGELTFEVGPDAERVRVAAGGFVAVPPNVVHTYVNDATTDSRWLNMHAPEQGFADYLRALRDGTQVAFDSFDPPADGGLPAGDVIVSGPGEGERVESGGRTGLIKAVLPELSVAEWTLDGRGPPEGGPLDAFYELEPGRIIHLRAPDEGFADSLRRGRE